MKACPVCNSTQVDSFRGNMHCRACHYVNKKVEDVCGEYNVPVSNVLVLREGVMRSRAEIIKDIAVKEADNLLYIKEERDGSCN